MPLPKEDPEKKKKDGELVPGLAKGYNTKGMYSGAFRGGLRGTLGAPPKTGGNESKGDSAVQRAAKIRLQAKIRMQGKK